MSLIINISKKKFTYFDREFATNQLKHYINLLETYLTEEEVLKELSFGHIRNITNESDNWSDWNDRLDKLIENTQYNANQVLKIKLC